jgi:hypothetical protein
MTDQMDREFEALQRAVAGRFSLQRELGRGGMGVVYQAQDVALDRSVAIKVLPLHLAGDAIVRERFIREARVAAGLSHPNIVPIHAVEEHGDLAFFVMSLIEGETLRQVVERRGPLPVGQAVGILRDVAWALGHAHGRGVVHRDIKPDNVLIERGTGRAVVTDFGIAHLAEASELTGTGQIVGTVHYMSPEHASGQPVDGRSDLYSLGVTAFFALTGQLPFDGPHAHAIVARHLTEPAPAIATLRSELPRALAGAIDRCLAKDPAERPESAEALAQALRADGETASTIAPEVRFFLRHGHTSGTQLAMLVGILILGMLFLPSSALLLFAAVLGLMGIGVLAELPLRARDLLERGFTVEDVRQADAADLEERQAEALRQLLRRYRLPSSRPVALVTGALATIMGGVSIVLWATTFPELATSLSAAVSTFVLLVGGGVMMSTMGVSGVLHAVSPERTRRALERFARKVVGGPSPWAGVLGTVVFRIAGLRLEAETGVVANPSPTEQLVLDAANGLVSRLPTAERSRVSRARGVMRALAERAARLRVRMQELEATLDEVGRVGRGPAGVLPAGDMQILAERRAATVADLEAARDRVRNRLATVIAAMESVRLALLRLKAGIASVEEITADLDAADAVAAEIQAEIEVHDMLRRT